MKLSKVLLLITESVVSEYITMNTTKRIDSTEDTGVAYAAPFSYGKTG